MSFFGYWIARSHQVGIHNELDLEEPDIVWQILGLNAWMVVIAFGDVFLATVQLAVGILKASQIYFTSIPSYFAYIITIGIVIPNGWIYYSITKATDQFDA